MTDSQESICASKNKSNTISFDYNIQFDKSAKDNCEHKSTEPDENCTENIEDINQENRNNEAFQIQQSLAETDDLISLINDDYEIEDDEQEICYRYVIRSLH